MPLTNEQRAHDLAIAILGSSEREKIFSAVKSEVLDTDNPFELYAEAYKLLVFTFENESLQDF